jgi:hypothetical protein
MHDGYYSQSWAILVPSSLLIWWDMMMSDEGGAFRKVQDDVYTGKDSETHM